MNRHDFAFGFGYPAVSAAGRFIAGVIIVIHIERSVEFPSCRLVK